MKLSEIDKNFAVSQVGSTEFVFRNCLEAPFRVYGLRVPNAEDPHFMRLPQRLADQVNENVKLLASCTSGGRVRFRTDSALVAIRAKMHNITKAPHFPMTGTAGFDIYADGTYRGTFVPPYEIADGFEAKVDLRGKKMRDIIIHMPLYAGVISLEIGVEPGSELLPGDGYTYTTPVLYYGSSITQGGCASRPGNSYQNIISRKLDCDYVNLGFSSGALAEECMIDYMAGLPMSVFVMDYDHNAPTPEYLEATHEKMYRRFRKACPDTPIVMITMPKVTATENSIRRRATILSTYEKAKAEGDSKVYFIDGHEMMAALGDDGGLVDDCHPNDLGFLCMARTIGAVVKEILET